MRRSRITVPVVLVATLLATIGIVPTAQPVRAAGEVAVAASGSIATGGGSHDTLNVTATDDGAGGIAGRISLQIGGIPVDGTVECVSVSGTSAVVAGSGMYWDGFDYVPRYLTAWLTDDGPSGTTDTAAVAISTTGPADCGVASPTQQTLAFGQVSILTGPSDAGAVAGDGTSAYGLSGTRSWSFDATRDAGGVVSGTFSIAESPSGFTISGTIDCLDIRGGRALIIGSGAQTGGGGGGGGGPTTWTATFFVEDVGPWGSGDTIAVEAYSNLGPSACAAAQTIESDGLITGYIDVNGVGGGTTPPAAATVVGTGSFSSGFGGGSTSFDVAAISDGAGGVDGEIRISPTSGSPVSGSITCLVVSGNSIVVGGQGTIATGGFPPDQLIVWFTLYLTDNGSDGSSDTAAIDGPGNMAPPDCTSSGPPQQALTYGQVTIVDWASDPGRAFGSATMDLGGGDSRSLTFDATRQIGGAIAGTFAVTESPSGFSLSGTIDCLDIRGETAMLIGHGPAPDGGGGGGGGPSTMYATFFIEDGGPAGSGDRIAFGAYTGIAPFSCLAARQDAWTSLVSGDVDVAAGPPLTVTPAPGAPASVERMGRFEQRFQLDREYGTDVHDPDVIDVTATFTAPSGATYVVPAFFGQDYTLRPGTGIGGSELYDPVPLDPPAPGIWHVRFSPDETGTWTFRIRAQDKTPGEQSVAYSTVLSFTATASTARGQIERDPRDSRFLRYADGTPYLPMGQNVAFGDGNPFNDGSHYYEPHFASMQAAGQNWARVWMTDFYITSLEWAATHWSGQYDGVGQYGDIPAFRVDQILELAEEYGLELQLVLNDHGQFSDTTDARWWENPYSTANGGPVPAADPGAFFSDPTARELHKQRLRYLVARYGAYRSILAWELFNEIQFTGSAARNPYNSPELRDEIVAWHAEMAAYLRSIDPYDHLITTSSDIESSMAAIWADPNIDLVQVHDYGANSGRDERFAGYATNLNATYDKPVVIGEFGLSGNPEPGFDPTTSTLSADQIAHLVAGTHLHNAMWAGAMSASGAMSWWWGNYIRDDAAKGRVAPDFPQNEQHSPPLRDFFAGEDLAGMGLEPSDISAPATVVALGLDNGSEGFAWVRDALNEYGSGVGPGDQAGRTISGVTIALAGFTDGTFDIEVHDPWAEEPAASLTAAANGGTLSIPLPDFQRDIALKIRPSASATAADPLIATATSPNAGTVTITEAPTTDPPPVGSGYTFLDAQLDIGAPAATTADPLVLVFTVDATLLTSVDPDLTAATLAVFRDGIPVAACTADTGDDPAAPDPCVSSRETLSGGDDEGDARITVLTSAASTWNVGSLPTPTQPDAPTNVVASPRDGRATIVWTAPSDGISPITSYTVTASPGGQSAASDGPVSVVTMSGLTNGTPYTFTVTATNAVGTGPASAPSSAVTPAASVTGVTLVQPDTIDADYAFLDGMTPDGAHLYYSRYQHAPDLGRDLWAWSDGERTLISTGPSASGSTQAQLLAFSPDGERVIFHTATALVPEDDDGTGIDIYVREGTTTTLVSTGPLDPNGTSVDEGMWFIAASPDGRQVVFQTAASLVAEDTDDRTDHYLRDGTTTTLLSIGPAGGNGSGSWELDAQPDGSVYDPGCGCLRMYFGTYESLVAEDTDTSRDIYESADGALRLVTPTIDDPFGQYVGASPDGSRVFFTTSASLVAADTDASTDIYVNAEGTIHLISNGPPGPDSYAQGVSPDGRAIAYVTTGQVLPDDVDGNSDLYEWRDGVTRRMTQDASGIGGGESAYIYDGGRRYRGSVYLFSTSGRLDASDTDDRADIYAWDGSRSRLVSTVDGGGDVRIRAISEHGSHVFAQSYQAITPDDVDLAQDVYRFPVLHDDDVELVTAAGSSPGGQGDIDFAGTSADGMVVAMTTTSGLTPDDDEPPDVGAATDVYVTTQLPPADPPGPPTAVVAVRGDAQAGVSWTAPTGDGGAAITEYTVTSSPGGLTATVDGTTTTAVVTGLTNGISYTFTVRATNIAGPGTPSAPSNAVTPGPRLAQTITFTNPGNKTMLQTPFTVTATSTSGLPVTVSSTTPTVCTISGFEVTLVAAGSCSLTATQAGNLTYLAASPITRTFTVSQVNQSITFTNPGNKTMLQTPFTVTATSTSGLPVTVASTTPAVCTIDAFEVTLVAAGSCSLTATQAGNAVYRPATTVTRRFTVSQVAQTITFAKPANAHLLQSPLTVTATASSGLPVTLTSTTPATCSASGFEITLIAAGTCTIRATQPGDVIYRPATAVSRSFTVTKAPQTITIADPGPQSMLVPTVVISAWASSDLPVTLASTSTTVCTITGDVVTLKKVGTCKIRGTQAGNATYAAATAVVRQFSVTAATALPFVVSAGTELTVAGSPFRLHGAAIYHTSNPGAPNDPARIVTLASQGGLNALRLVNMFVEDGTSATAPYAEADWQRVDRLLARARGAGMRVVLDLSAFRNHLVRRDIAANGWVDDCVGGADRSAVDYDAIDPYRAGLAGEWEDFLDFVVDRVNTVNGLRYGNDATIAVISIAGEPQPPASEECGKATTTAGLTDFYERTLGYLASIDPNHLRSNGGLIHLDWEQVYGGGSSGIDGEAIFALDDNTLPSLHTYPPEYASDGTPIDHTTPVYGPLADSLGKPWFTEEFGWEQSVGDAERAAYFAWLYDEGDANGSDGELFWNLGIEMTGGSHDVSPATPLTWTEVRAR